MEDLTPTTQSSTGQPWSYQQLETPFLSFSSSQSTNDARPTTPQASVFAEPPQNPPNPPKVRIKRRRGPVAPFIPQSLEKFAQDEPLPTIEVAPEQHEFDRNLEQLPPLAPPNHRYLSPVSSFSADNLVSEPKTPVGQLSIDNGFDEHDWSQVSSLSKGASIARPTSAWSELSDSSNTSLGSSVSNPSYGGSCTSPESENTDPFTFPEVKIQPPRLSSPLQFQKPTSRKRRRMHAPVKWTSELDEHLWITYMTYLSDPTVTPFKILPGTAPPLGVCHRVAREAKKSWKGKKTAHLNSISENQPSTTFASLDGTVMRHSSVPLEADSPETIRPPPALRSHSSNDFTRSSFSKWPKSGSSTRKRLRELCKRRPALSPHYTRLMQRRSPSPFASSSSGPKARSSRYSSPPVTRAADSESSYSTRDLHFTLATSTAASMQPDGPLSQLARTPRPEDYEQRTFVPQPSPRSNTHQKSQSLHLGMGLTADPETTLRRLASPFKENSNNWTWAHGRRPEFMHRRAQISESSAQGQLDSPFEIHAPRPLSGSMKRRAQYQLGEEHGSEDLGNRRNFLEDLFRDPVANGNRRVRSRGFSLGAMRQEPPSRPLAELFSPPTLEEPEPSQAAQTSSNPVGATTSSYLDTPSVDHVGRLGSPFAPRSNASFSNTFPRSLFPNGLDSITAFEQQQQQQRPDQDLFRQNDPQQGNASSPPFPNP